MINPLTGGLEFSLPKEKSLDDDFTDVNVNFCPVMSTLPIEEKIKLVKEVGEEILNEDEIRGVFERNPMPVCYDGFEPSGRQHIAQGILRAINVNRLTKAGCVFIFWVADWFAQMNNKMGGDLEKIKIVGRYFIEIWKAVGMDLKNVKFLWASEQINKEPMKYWQNVIDVARHNTVDRITRCCQIMGRKDDNLSAGQIMYPCMQCTDISFLKADFTSLGMDQRKVNVLCREYCDDIKQKIKPVIVSHHMLMGLVQGCEKMSKSIPDSAIFMEDSKEDVERKIKKAFCPEKIVEGNPLFDYIKYLIFPKEGEFRLLRSEKNGGNKTYKDYESLCEDYKKGDVHPGDLKPSTAKHINDMIEPVREHFRTDPEAKRVLELVRSFEVTR
ncbi:MAG: tyrosine--tRNA ligase [archaeon]|nr:tyrosine--tRNA ligase [archaeon]